MLATLVAIQDTLFSIYSARTVARTAIMSLTFVEQKLEKGQVLRGGDRKALYNLANLLEFHSCYVSHYQRIKYDETEREEGS